MLAQGGAGPPKVALTELCILVLQIPHPEIPRGPAGPWIPPGELENNSLPPWGRSKQPLHRAKDANPCPSPLHLICIILLLCLLVILLKSLWDVTARDFVFSCRNLMNVNRLNSVHSALWTQLLDVPISLQAEDRQPSPFSVPPFKHKLPCVSLNQ